jgi:purine-cytosine permease-like protein
MVMYPAFIILAGFGGRYYQNLPIPASGQTEMADWMSFMATCLGYAVTWGPFSADYSVYMKEDTRTIALFSWTYFSLITTQILIMILGAALATTIPGNPTFADAFETAGTGGLMNASFTGYNSAVYGFGKFIQLILVLSTIAVTIPNVYSLALSVQNVGPWCVKVPRFIWTTLGFIVFTVAGIAGRDHFATILENFLNCLAYWYPIPTYKPILNTSNLRRVVPWTTIVVLEMWWFRRGGRNPMNLDLWWSQKGVPYGFAAITTWACSVVLAIMSMSQVWYVGPIAIAAGGAPYGVDLGWCNSLALALVLYPPLRYLELWKFGK